MTTSARRMHELADWVEGDGSGSSYGWIAAVIRVMTRDSVGVKTALNTAHDELHYPGCCDRDEPAETLRSGRAITSGDDL